MNTFFKTILFSFFFLLCLPRLVFGAEFLLSSQAAAIHTNDEFTIDLSVDTEGANANAFGGEIFYPQDLLQLQEIRDGNSIVNFWVSAPALGTSSISFSGITPGGYQGAGKILSLVFLAKEPGTGAISIENSQILRNDGSGSELAATSALFVFSIATSSGAGQIVPPIVNTSLPESFVPEIGRNENIFNNAWFVAFSTTDKASGIAEYEVRETRYPLFAFFTGWQTAESPYQLRDQNLHSYISVKAINTAGNTRIETLSPQNPLPFYENLEYWFILIVMLAALACTFLWKKSEQK